MKQSSKQVSGGSDRPSPLLAGFPARCRELAAGRGTPLQVRAYTLGFTLAVTVFFGLLVAVLHAALRERTLLRARARRGNA